MAALLWSMVYGVTRTASAMVILQGAAATLLLIARLAPATAKWRGSVEAAGQLTMLAAFAGCYEWRIPLALLTLPAAGIAVLGMLRRDVLVTRPAWTRFVQASTVVAALISAGIGGALVT